MTRAQFGIESLTSKTGEGTLTSLRTITLILGPSLPFSGSSICLQGSASIPPFLTPLSGSWTPFDVLCGEGWGAKAQTSEQPPGPWSTVTKSTHCARLMEGDALTQRVLAPNARCPLVCHLQPSPHDIWHLHDDIPFSTCFITSAKTHKQKITFRNC